mmetsp:Transcript_23582/g.52662  ORF Transcript_23582/g.52662 Transcript_23582/m.52662 type:complete len:899 (-) Transcript_23582:93-2789(-)
MRGIVEGGGVPPPPPHVKLIRDRATDVVSYLDEESLRNAACSCLFLNGAVEALRESRARRGPTTFATPPRRDTNKMDAVASLTGNEERLTKYDEFMAYLSSGPKASDKEKKNTDKTSPRSVAGGLTGKATVDDINQPSFSSAPDVPKDASDEEDELDGGGQHSLLLAIDAFDKEITSNNARPAKDERRSDEGAESKPDNSDSIGTMKKVDLLSVEDQSDQLVLAFNSKRLAGTPISFLTAPSVSENCRHSEVEGDANSSELDNVDGDNTALVQEKLAALPTSLSLGTTASSTECDGYSPARFFTKEGGIITLGRVQCNRNESSDAHQTMSLGTSIDVDAIERDATITPLATETSFESCQSGSIFDENQYDDIGEIPMKASSISRQSRRNMLPVVDETAVPHLPPALDVPALDESQARESRFSRDYLVAEQNHDGDASDIMGQFTPQLLTDFMSELMVSAKHAANLVFTDGGRGSRAYLPANDIDDDGPIKIGEKFYSHNEALQLWRKAKIKLEDQYCQIDDRGNVKYKKVSFLEKSSVLGEEVEEVGELSEEELLRRRTLWREARNRQVQHDIDDNGNARVERAAFFEKNSVFKEEPSCEGYELKRSRQTPEEDGEAVSLNDLIRAYTIFEARKRSVESAMSADKTAVAQNAHVTREATNVREVSEEPTNDDAKPSDVDVNSIKTGPNSERSDFESQASGSNVDTTTDEESISTSENSQDASDLVNVNGCNFSATHTSDQESALRQISNSSELTPTIANQNAEKDSEAESVANDSVLGSTYGLELTASSVGSGMKAKFISGGEVHSVNSFGVKSKQENDAAMGSQHGTEVLLQKPKLSSARKPRKLASHNFIVAKAANKAAQRPGQPSRLHKLSASSLKLQKKAGSTLPKLFHKPGRV